MKLAYFMMLPLKNLLLIAVKEWQNSITMSKDQLSQWKIQLIRTVAEEEEDLKDQEIKTLLKKTPLNYQQQGQKKHQCVRLAKGLATSQINEQ